MATQHSELPWEVDSETIYAKAGRVRLCADCYQILYRAGLIAPRKYTKKRGKKA